MNSFEERESVCKFGVSQVVGMLPKRLLAYKLSIVRFPIETELGSVLRMTLLLMSKVFKDDIENRLLGKVPLMLLL